MCFGWRDFHFVWICQHIFATLPQIQMLERILFCDNFVKQMVWQQTWKWQRDFLQCKLAAFPRGNKIESCFMNKSEVKTMLPLHHQLKQQIFRHNVVSYTEWNRTFHIGFGYTWSITVNLRLWLPNCDANSLFISSQYHDCMKDITSPHHDWSLEVECNETDYLHF